MQVIIIVELPDGKHCDGCKFLVDKPGFASRFHCTLYSVPIFNEGDMYTPKAIKAKECPRNPEKNV